MASVKLNYKKPMRNIGIGAAALAVIFAVFIAAAVHIDNDGSKMADRSAAKLVTRTPLNGCDIFSGAKPNTGIMLSWHDNTIKLEPEQEDARKETLSGVLYPVILPDVSLNYESSNTEIADVAEDGTITAKSPGSVEISVSNELTGEQSKAYLQVVQPVTGFYLKKSTINLYTTDTSTRLESEITPYNASNMAVQWYSKDKNIVEVDQTGHLNPVNTGMTEVVATTTDGGFTGKCFVNVINEIIKAEKVAIQNKKELTLKVGENWDAIVSVLPANARNKSVEWTSDNEKVVTVTKAGKIRAVGEGKAVVTAKNSDGPSDTMNVTVSGKIETVNNINMGGTSYASATQAGVTYKYYDMTLEEMTDIQMSESPAPKIDGSAGSREKVMEYIDPNYFCSGAYRYQFMDLSKVNGVTAEAIDKFLEGKGTLSGQGEAFVEAAREYNISELYLVAHACLETGYGTSTLASGVEVNGTKVYNMFGIAAYDNSVVSSGSNKAYQEGWTTPAAAIKGGAKWISEHYINAADARQNTLYKMRWNPDNPGEHNYASSAEWATIQATIMERLFDQFPEAVLAYEIPVYKGSNAAVIDDAAAMANTSNTGTAGN